MINLVLTDEQAKSLVAVLYSGVSAESIKIIGLDKVLEPMLKEVGRYTFDRDYISFLWLPEKARVVRKEDPPDETSITIDCT
jgi:hypothetical protein